MGERIFRVAVPLVAVLLSCAGEINSMSVSARTVALDATLALTSTVQAHHSLALGRSHSCALTSNGGVKCWGSNASGQLGDGTTTDSITPVDVVGLSSGVIMIAAGSGHTCALTSSGGVKCWGENIHGELGDTTTTARQIPVGVSGLNSGVSAISAAGEDACALTTGGEVKCWGENMAGQLGIGWTSAYSTTPVGVTGLSSGVTAIDVGGFHNCAVRNGGAKCWGANYVGQVGDGTVSNIRTTPVDVVGLSFGVTMVAAGGSHSCALTDNGGVKCWGWNPWGQLGDGTTNYYSPIPVNVVGRSNGTISVVASDSTCSLITGGAVQCWGHNAYGELGDGTTTNRNTPGNVSGLTGGVTEIARGGAHNCARTSDGGVKCWGWNVGGQLGDGTTIDRYTPVDAKGLGYTIAGRITDTTVSNGPIPGVTVVVGSTIHASNVMTVTTNATGYYTFRNLTADTYTVTPFPGSYAFSPAWSTVILKSDAPGENFSGIPTQYGNAVTPIRQFSLPWGSETYDGISSTITTSGCLLTDLTMLINYWGAKTTGFSTDPATLNTWLRNNQGYDTGGGIVYRPPYTYSVQSGVPLYFDNWVQPDNATLDSYLKSGSPVILQEKDHYVLAIGKVVDGGVDTYAIVDPSYNRSTLKDYGYSYLSMELYTTTIPSILTGLYISAHSPVELLVTDPSGHRTGYDSTTGTILTQIPNSSYIAQSIGDPTNPNAPAPDSKVFYASGIGSGTYKLQIIGTGSGSYTLNLIGYSRLGSGTFRSISGQTSNGQVQVIQIPYSTNSGLNIGLYLPFIAK